MAKAQPFFSVVIPTYNRADDVCAAVKSVLNQTDTDFEILVVDDAGTDNTAQKLAEINDKRLTYLKQPKNAGAKAARNRGIREAKGQWLCLLDSDDEWLPNRLKNLREMIQKTPNAANTLFWSSLIFNRGDGVVEVKPKSPKPAEMPYFDYIMCYDGLIQTSTLALSAEKAKNHPFNEAVLGHDDYEFLFGLEKAGLIFHHDPRAQVIWHNQTVAATGRVSYTNRLKKFRQWIDVHGTDMSPKAMAAYKALNLALCYGGLKTPYALALILNAGLKGAIPPRRVLLSCIQALMPDTSYRKLIKCLAGQTQR